MHRIKHLALVCALAAAPFTGCTATETANSNAGNASQSAPPPSP